MGFVNPTQQSFVQMFLELRKLSYAKPVDIYKKQGTIKQKR